MSQQQHTQYNCFLFGEGGPWSTVEGAPRVTNKLYVALEVDNLTVSRKPPKTFDQAITIATQVVREKIFHEDVASLDRAMSGRGAGTGDTGQDNSADDSQRIHDLGILTQLGENTLDVTAQINSARPGVESKHTLWVHRQVSFTQWGGEVVGWRPLVKTITVGFDEEMMAFMRAPLLAGPAMALIPTMSLQAPPAMSQNAPPTGTPLHHQVPPLPPAIKGTATMPPPPLPQQPPPILTQPAAPPAPPVTAPIDPYAQFTNEEILSGMAGVHPKLITGQLILRLALHYDNTTLSRRINVLYAMQGQGTRGVDAYSQRISLANKRVAEEDPSLGGYEAVRLRFDRARRANGVNINVTRVNQRH
ncbi:hypothetical protein TI39_contig490g00008 [Zymoseptoria brevis]|uniref:Uncharacterized protein n=1 Tax=Zymoseptoria brevis TaxID=1047168 RepID=A0A0F4GJB3_9PEZI|nr:hypothetical protein TI39_contig490g00008 [Zymoseptoria brevis]